MPNHVVTKVSLWSANGPEVIKSFWDTCFTKNEIGEQVFDFNTVIPQPKDLDITSGGLAMFIENQFSERATMKELIEGIKKSELSAVENFAKAVVNLKKYGYATWYHWRVKNWGTKWGAYDLRVTSDTEFQFQTAWSHPMPIFEKLSEMFPDLQFIIRYADEDLGSNLGHYSILNKGFMGLDFPMAGSRAARRWAGDLHGYTPEGVDDRDRECGIEVEEAAILTFPEQPQHT